MKHLLSTLFVSLIFPLTTLAQTSNEVARSSYVGSFISTTLLLIKNILLPLAFGIAFLVFLVNTTRYFIIESTSEEGRTKAKRSALLSVAAFVFLLSLWTVVTLTINALGLRTSTSAACPDYLEQFGGLCFTDWGGNNITGGSFNDGNPFTEPDYGGGGSSNGGSTGGGDPVGGGSNGGSTGGGDPFFSGLAELVFGTGRDITLGEVNTLPPAAAASTVTIDTTASCIDAVTTLQLAARSEVSQAGYLFLPASTTRWHNVTDVSAREQITFDDDTLTALMTPGEPAHLFHTHPDIRPDDLDLTMFGHGPTKADFIYACAHPDFTHTVVDETGVWSYSFAAGSCPVPLIDEVKLSLIETYLSLSMLEATTREPELTKYIQSDLTSSVVDAVFAPLATPKLADYSIAELQATSTDLQQSVGLTVRYFEDVVTFCDAL